VSRAATVESDAFDKTFAIAGGKVIGGFSSLMRFSGKTISEHVLEIATPLIRGTRTIQSLAPRIEAEITDRLAHIDDQEVIFPCRKLDVFLVTGANLTRSDMQIVSISFFPKQNLITSGTETVAANTRNRYFVRGEDKAAAAAARLLANDRPTKAQPS